MRIARTLLALLVVFPCLAAFGEQDGPAGRSNYTEVFYQSGKLRIQAYLYKPAGDSPFPAVIYNHGSRSGREQKSVPFEYVGEMLARAGYVVLVPERRGYGKSDGQIWWNEVGNDQARLIPRLRAETDDVLAALDYLRALSFVDTKRVGIMGWSFGGIVTMLAVSRGNAFAVAVDQAGGALTWNENTYVRSALVDAAEKTTTPTLLMVAQNDRTTSSITTLAEILKKRGVPHRMAIYEPFTPQKPSNSAPGHAVFSSQGVQVWEQDVLEYLGRYLGAAPLGTPSTGTKK